MLFPSWLSPAISLLKAAKKSQRETLINWLFKLVRLSNIHMGFAPLISDKAKMRDPDKYLVVAKQSISTVQYQVVILSEVWNSVLHV